jgi:hypothetical protein
LDMLPLTDIVAELRRQLDEARSRAEDERVKLTVEAIDLELQVTASAGAEAGGGFKFWVISGEARTKVAAESIQKVHLKLKPLYLDDAGEQQALDIQDNRRVGPKGS